MSVTRLSFETFVVAKYKELIGRNYTDSSSGGRHSGVGSVPLGTPNQLQVLRPKPSPTGSSDSRSISPANSQNNPISRPSSNQSVSEPMQQQYGPPQQQTQQPGIGGLGDVHKSTNSAGNSPQLGPPGCESQQLPPPNQTVNNMATPPPQVGAVTGYPFPPHMIGYKMGGTVAGPAGAQSQGPGPQGYPPTNQNQQYQPGNHPPRPQNSRSTYTLPLPPTSQPTFAKNMPPAGLQQNSRWTIVSQTGGSPEAQYLLYKNWVPPSAHAEASSSIGNHEQALGEDPDLSTSPGGHLVHPRATGEAYEISSRPNWTRTPASMEVLNSHVPRPETFRTSTKKLNSLRKLYEIDDNPERLGWLEKLRAFMEERGTPITACPTIAKQLLDLYKLYIYVKERGGFVEVTKRKMWKDITALLGVGACSNAAYTLRKHYTKCLLAFECHFDRGNSDPLPIMSLRGHGIHSYKYDAFQAPGANLNAVIDGYRYPSGCSGAGLQPHYAACGQIQRPSFKPTAQTLHAGGWQSDSNQYRSQYPAPPTPPTKGGALAGFAGGPLGPTNQHAAAAAQWEQQHPYPPQRVLPPHQQPPYQQPAKQQPTQWVQMDTVTGQPPHAASPGSFLRLSVDIGVQQQNFMPSGMQGMPSIRQQQPPPGAPVLRDPGGKQSGRKTKPAPCWMPPLHPTAPGHCGVPSGMMVSQQKPPGPPLQMGSQPPQFRQPARVQLAKEKISFPSDSVEATTPVLYRRKRLSKADVCPIDPRRLVMAMRSGLLSECTWALDVLNVLLIDDTSMKYCCLTRLPGLLTVLLEHFQKNLAQMFHEDDETETEAKIALPYEETQAVTGGAWSTFTFGIMEHESADGFIDVFKSEIIDIPFARSVRGERMSRKLRAKLAQEQEQKTAVDEKAAELKLAAARANTEENNKIQLTFNKKRRLFNNICNNPGTPSANEASSAKKSKLLQEEVKREPADTPVLNDSDCREVNLEIETIQQQKRLPNGHNSKEFDPKASARDPARVLQRQRDSSYEDECYTRDEASLNLVNESQNALAMRCICISNILRNLTFVPGNETILGKSSCFLALLGRLLLLKHEHLQCMHKTRNFVGEEDTDFTDFCSSLHGEREWWWEYLITIRESMLVAIANIAGYIDLSLYDEIIARPLLDGLLHWAVCPSAVGQDPFPSCGNNSSLSPQRLALEALCKLCVTDANVDLVIATPPHTRLEKLCAVLTQHLCPIEDQVLREFSVNLLNYLAAADSAMARIVAMQSPCVSYLIAFIEQADKIAWGVAKRRGINYLRENPDSMGTSLDMLRRAADTLLHLVKHPDNRSLIMQQEHRLLELAMSHILDQHIALIISQVLFEVSCGPGPTPTM